MMRIKADAEASCTHLIRSFTADFLIHRNFFPGLATGAEMASLAELHRQPIGAGLYFARASATC